MSLIVSSNHINRYQTIHKHNVLLSISSKNLVKKWWDVQCIYSMLANSSFKEDRKYGAWKCKRNQKKELQWKETRRKLPLHHQRREHQQQSWSPSVCVIMKTQPVSSQLGWTQCETSVTASKHGGEEAAGPGVVAGDHLANQLARCQPRIQRR